MHRDMYIVTDNLTIDTKVYQKIATISIKHSHIHREIRCLIVDVYIYSDMRTKRRISNDVQWCIDNEETVSARTFAEHFGFIDRHYTTSRYRTIITTHLQDCPHLLQEYNTWKKLEECNMFWNERKCKKDRFTIGNAVIDQFNIVATAESIPMNENLNQTSSLVSDIPKTDNNDSDEALTNSLLLKLQQHSRQLLSIFPISELDSLYVALKSKLDKNVVTQEEKEEEVLMKVTRIINKVDKKKLSRDNASIQLTILAKEQEYHIARVIKAVNNLLQKIPSHDIKDLSSLSESELYNTYVDPILSAIISDPERETLLRWTNKTDDETDYRLDATITRTKQMSFDHNLGHGEVKRCGRNVHDLALDLLRILILAKDTLDFYKLDSSFGVQNLNHIYTMLEVERVKVPRSVVDLSTFLSLNNFQCLIYVCRVFWANCKKTENEALLLQRHKTHTTKLILFY
ncbi:uncharacterized protein BX663DRAFT_483489 [Cokeromyces recurvatus]|uniref:uncharacterized protein n=1 Tax=Cokeromyces recurvatus TaxID=90255 RepID=UPI00221EB22B|nr:uncharacterized protein BX663DRAFT_483489 [Cokeromyces recurvatus]KAI7906807.1 hypothetical protein BX663DRAFT_483489 [Cokeromyces recurvatus]